jgi:TonB family protein
MMVELKLEDIPPPPTDHIEFMRQIVKQEVTPPKPPELKPTPKPVPKVQPRFTAPKATGSGNSMAVSAFAKGTSGLPIPGYPQEALQAGEGGTVLMHVTFGPSGEIENAEVSNSCGVTLLDTWTRNFIYGHWKNASMAGRDVHVPIIYDPSQHTVH